MSGSVRSAHSNAYYFGFLGNKRIVIYDTLVGPEAATDISSALAEAAKEGGGSGDYRGNPNSGCTVPQIVAVVAHELGHWAHGHVMRMFTLQWSLNLVLFYAFSRFVYWAPMYEQFGFGQERPLIAGFYIFFAHLFAPLSVVLGMVFNGISRYHEFQADAYAAKHETADDLAAALLKLHQDNRGFPVNDWLYSALHHSHPTLIERLEQLEGDTGSAAQANKDD